MVAPILRRIPSGIPGLDRLIEGGFLQNSVNLITGSTGTGKSTLCLQFLWQGLKKGESGVYISLEQDPDEIKADALHFGWDFDKFIKKGLCNIKYHDPAQINNIGAVLIDEIGNLKAKRLVIDSTAVMGLTLDNLSQIRKRLLTIINTIKKIGCTAIIVSEIDEDSKALSRFGVEEFVVDGVIVLYYIAIGKEGFGNIQVRKMRRTAHEHGLFPTKITKKGLDVGKESVMLIK